MSIEMGIVLRLATEIRNYIRDRAKVEGVGFDLTLELFVEGVLNNARIFGVHHNGCWMLCDEQEPSPGYFRDWTSKHTPKTAALASDDFMPV